MKDNDRHLSNLTRADKAVPLLALAVFVMSFLVSLNTLKNGFVLDDSGLIFKNLYITDIGYLPEIFLSAAWAFQEDATNFYRPLMHVLYMAARIVFGYEPWGFHLVNVILHSTNSVLVFYIAARLFKETDAKPFSGRAHAYAFSTALLFSTHPIHVEVVAWVAAMPELSFTLFYLLSLFLHMRGKRLLSLPMYFLALLSKEPAVTLIPIMATYDVFMGKKRGNIAFWARRYGPHMAVTAIYFAMRLYALGGMAPRVGLDISWPQSVIAMLPLFFEYLKKLSLPIGLHPFFSFNPYFRLTDPGFLVPLALFAATPFLLYRLYRAKNGLVPFSVAFLVLPLAPVLYIRGLDIHVYADRYAYLSSFGFVMAAALAVGGAARMSRGRHRTVVLASLVLVTALGYSALTIRGNSKWKDYESLLNAALAMKPDHYHVHHIMGSNFNDNGRLDMASEELEKAITLNLATNRPYRDILKMSRLVLADVYRKKGELDKALGQIEAVLDMDAANPHAHYNMGLIYYDKGMFGLAVTSYEEALKYSRTDRDRKDIYNNMGNAYARLFLYEQAVASYEKALGISPDDPSAANNLRVVKRMMDRAAQGQAGP